MDYDAYDAILHNIFKQTQGDAWFKPDADNMACGVGLRVQPGIFRVFPYSNPLLEPFATALVSLNPEVAVKLRSAAIHASFAVVPESQDHFFIDTDTRIQVLDSIEDLSNAEKEQRAAFIRDERCLVVWEERVSNIIPSCADFEDRLVKLVWRERERIKNHGSLSGDRSPASTSAICIPSDESATPSGLTPPPAASNSPFARFPTSISRSSFTPTYGNIPPPEIAEKFIAESVNDIEKSTVSESGAFVTGRNRPTRIYANIYIGLATALAAIFVGNGISIVIREFFLDGNFMRFILLVTSPFIFCVSLFFALQLVNSLTFCFGPVAHYRENSKYFSAVAPGLPAVKIEKLPHITVQMPVYKENCKATIKPSINSIKEAMVTYARQGGTSSIFICDDGLQLVDDAEREERLKLYDESNIGWVARPKHSNELGGFIRAGRFKKASNLNYGLALSLRVEQLIAELEANPLAYAPDPFSTPSAISTPNSKPYTSPNIHVADLISNPNLSRCCSDSTTQNHTPNGNITIEERALSLAIAETSGQAWASGARSLRIGEIILLVDSDTMVPEDCFKDAARELAECPEVAIIQHESDVMQVAHHWFENGLAYFTRRINHCISAACANGEVSPFVGHNAFLRWSAIQDAAFTDSDGKTKFWSEEHVSEDFDMSLRLQIKGYIIRWATYSMGGFKEGVSLTCDDELNRWMKYAYGIYQLLFPSLLLFNPFVRWYRGPVTRQISRFVWSSVPVHYKISVLSYMFSYYGIAGSFTLTLMNYLLLGFSFPVDGYYMRSWETWLAITVVFVGAGNVGITMLDYRVYGKNLIASFWGNIKWIPYFFFFFGGLSLHLSGAILAHMFSYNMTWSATKKEVEVSNFFKEFPRVVKRFWLSSLVCFIVVGGMVVLSTSLIPEGWRIGRASWAVIFPLAIQVGCHILFPLVLNPWLMIFSY
ncbi:glycosyl transferase family group 2-domain-containing protein [Hysterangium stoloniferum]|nr:glycosyl transferase family group 2-domain-containing protein [Hysterangium stoloniferum]